MDHTGDGIADLQAERDAFGIEHVTVDTDGDTLADAEFTDGPFPADPPAEEEALFVVDDAPPVFDTAAPTVAPVPAGLTGDTAALVGGINSQMADAGLIHDSAMNPGSVSDTDVNAARHAFGPGPGHSLSPGLDPVPAHSFSPGLSPGLRRDRCPDRAQHLLGRPTGVDRDGAHRSVVVAADGDDPARPEVDSHQRSSHRVLSSCPIGASQAEPNQPFTWTRPCLRPD